MTAATRPEPPRTADERATLTGFLEFQRRTLALKCSGLTPEQLARRAVPPSALSLLGLVRHMAEVERSWFQDVIGGGHTAGYWGQRPDTAEFDVDGADPDEAFRVWHEACARSREVVAAAASLDATGRHRGAEFSLRNVLTHMVEEYARHNGHADLLRERLDGAVGE